MVANIAVRLWLPADSPIHVPWLVPTIEAGLVVVLVTAHPAGANERRRLRLVSLTLVLLLVTAALWATVLLVDDLIQGTGVTNKPSELLASGAIVWLGNNLAFAMLYWLMDGGGPIARRALAPVDFAFTQQMSPELAPPDWRPVFLDYLHLGFTNSTAFSPTDVMPLTLRAKVHDVGPVDGGAGAVRARRGARGERVHVTRDRPPGLPRATRCKRIGSRRPARTAREPTTRRSSHGAS
jgi:hypothetical protein